MACTDELEALRALLGCILADGARVSDAILEERNEAKLKKLTISELAPGMLLLATDEGRKRDKAPPCMSPLFKDDGVFAQNRACDAVLVRKADDGLQVYYIELKSDSPSGYEGQFVSTQCFMRYVEVWPKSSVAARSGFHGSATSFFIPTVLTDDDADERNVRVSNRKVPTPRVSRTCSV